MQTVAIFNLVLFGAGCVSLLLVVVGLGSPDWLVFYTGANGCQANGQLFVDCNTDCDPDLQACQYFLNHTSSTASSGKVKTARAFGVLTFFLLIGNLAVHLYSAIKLHAKLRMISSILYGVVALFGLITTAAFADEEKKYINSIPTFWAFDSKLVWGFGFGLFTTGWLLSIWIFIVYLALAYCFDDSDFSIYETKESKPSNQKGDFASIPLTPSSPSSSFLPTQPSSTNLMINTTTTSDTVPAATTPKKWKCNSKEHCSEYR